MHRPAEIRQCVFQLFQDTGMRKTQTEPIRTLLQEVLEELQIEKPILEARAVKAWGSVLGRSVAEVTDQLYFKNGILYVRLRSSVVRNEMQMLKTQLIPRLNEYIGKDIVKDVIFK